MTAPDVFDVRLSLGELCGLVAAAAAFGAFLVLAENIREGLVLAAGAGLAGYGLELGATVVAVTVGVLWAGIVGLATQVLVARAAAWALARRQRPVEVDG